MRARNPYEERLTELVEIFFKYKFTPNIRPSWLVNPKTGYKLELDLYSEKGKLAFELNGKYHYHPDYIGENRKYLDQLKKELCKQKGIRLIIVNSATLQDRLKVDKKGFSYWLAQQKELILRDGYFW